MKIFLRVVRRCRVMARIILACPSFLKLVSVRVWRSSAGSAYLVRRETTWFPTERHDSEFSRIKQTITFLGDDPARTKICYVFVTLMSPCLEGSYAKAACNNNDSLCCNDSNLYYWVKLKMYSKRTVSEACRPITCAFVKMRAPVIRTW